MSSRNYNSVNTNLSNFGSRDTHKPSSEVSGEGALKKISELN